jgi:hypothetical protein
VRLDVDPFTRELDINSPEPMDQPEDAVLFSPIRICTVCGEVLDGQVFESESGLTLRETDTVMPELALVDCDRAKVVGFLAALAMRMMYLQQVQLAGGIYSDIAGTIAGADLLVSAFFNSLGTSAPEMVLASDVAAKVKAYLDNVPAG